MIRKILNLFRPLQILDASPELGDLVVEFESNRLADSVSWGINSNTGEVLAAAPAQAWLNEGRFVVLDQLRPGEVLHEAATGGRLVIRHVYRRDDPSGETMAA